MVLTLEAGLKLFTQTSVVGKVDQTKIRINLGLIHFRHNLSKSAVSFKENGLGQ